jgi:hypothetical protein
MPLEATRFLAWLLVIGFPHFCNFNLGFSTRNHSSIPFRESEINNLDTINSAVFYT